MTDEINEQFEPESEERERVNTDKREDEAISQGLSLNSDTRNPNADTRPPRVPMQQGKNVDFSDVQMDTKNFKYYAFFDNPEKPGRIQSAKAAYWEEVMNIHGQPARRPAGNGYHILMRLPIQYWKEDLENKRKKVQATLADEGKLSKNVPGQFDEYAPEDGGKAEGGESMFVRHSQSDSPFVE